MKKGNGESNRIVIRVAIVAAVLIVCLALLVISLIRIEYTDSGIMPVPASTLASRFHAALGASTPASEMRQMFKGDWFVFSFPYKGHHTALHWAAAEGKIDLLEFFLDETPFNVSSQPGPNQDTPIHSAIRGSQIEAVDLLLTRGADVHLTGSDQLPALELAIQLDREEIADLIRRRH